MKDELAALDGALHLAGEDEPVAARDRIVLAEDLHAGPGRLRAVHRDVGVAHELRAVAPVVGYTAMPALAATGVVIPSRQNGRSRASWTRCAAAMIR